MGKEHVRFLLRSFSRDQDVLNLSDVAVSRNLHFERGIETAPGSWSAMEHNLGPNPFEAIHQVLSQPQETGSRGSPNGLRKAQFIQVVGRPDSQPGVAGFLNVAMEEASDRRDRRSPLAPACSPACPGSGLAQPQGAVLPRRTPGWPGRS